MHVRILMWLTLISVILLASDSCVGGSQKTSREDSESTEDALESGRSQILSAKIGAAISTNNARSRQDEPIFETTLLKGKIDVRVYASKHSRANLREATWEVMSDSYANLSTLDRNAIVFFIEPTYELPLTQDVPEFSRKVAFEEFKELNPNLEGWFFNRFADNGVELSRIVDHKIETKVVDPEEIKRKYPKGLLLYSWDYFAGDVGVTIVGVNLLDQRVRQAGPKIRWDSIDVNKVVGVSVFKNGRFTTYVDRVAIEVQLARVQLFSEQDEASQTESEWSEESEKGNT